MYVKVEVRCNLSLNTKCSCGEGGREGERMRTTGNSVRLVG